MDFNKIKRFYNTVKYLRLTQIFYRVKYNLFKIQRRVSSVNEEFCQITLKSYPHKRFCLNLDDKLINFNFLNINHTFTIDNINWSLGKYGNLWAYNLNYFDCLCQHEMSAETGLKLLKIYYKKLKFNPVGLNAYPASLRVINISKFISVWDINESWLFNELLADLNLIKKRLEYNILGNHLLENAFALYIGGVITNQSSYYELGRRLLNEQLNEQILDDGMHYERSPMYHLIILERLLDTLNFSNAVDDKFQKVLEKYALMMLSYALNWKDLERIPMMQDSAYHISISLKDLLTYGKLLLQNKFPKKASNLGSSGYRIKNSNKLKLIINVGSISPQYQPGHSHADELNFELYYSGKPIIVDKGVSTYEKNNLRFLERSTKSHNCLTINDENSSEVWSGFRVGNRANVTLEKDNEIIKAFHNGYKGYKISREIISNNSSINILDSIKQTKNKKKQFGIGRIHFHPDITIKKISKNIYQINNSLLLNFISNYSNNINFKIENYEYANGFNKLKNAKVIIYNFYDKIKISVSEKK